MAIANIFLYGKSLYDHQGPRTRILAKRIPRKRLNGCGAFSRVQLRDQSHDLVTSIQRASLTSVMVMAPNKDGDI